MVDDCDQPACLAVLAAPVACVCPSCMSFMQVVVHATATDNDAVVGIEWWLLDADRFRELRVSLGLRWA